MLYESDWSFEHEYDFILNATVGISATIKEEGHIQVSRAHIRSNHMTVPFL